MRKAIVILAAFTVALCTPGTPGGMMDSSEPAELPLLSGLKGIHVRVTYQGSARLEEYGFELTEQKLQAETESLIRKHGLKVFSTEDLDSVEGRPELLIAVHMFTPEGSQMAAINMAFNLVENVYLGRRPGQQIRAAVWSMSSLTFVDLDKPQELGPMREDLAGMVDSFSRAHATANPPGG